MYRRNWNYYKNNTNDNDNVSLPNNENVRNALEKNYSINIVVNSKGSNLERENIGIKNEVNNPNTNKTLKNPITTDITFSSLPPSNHKNNNKKDNHNNIIGFNKYDNNKNIDDNPSGKLFLLYKYIII